MTVALRPAIARGDDPLVGGLPHGRAGARRRLVATTIAGGWDLAGAWPFLLAGVLAPGCSQVLFTFAVREAGPSRTSATVGTAPLFAVAFAVVLLGEPLVAGVVVGAVLIVGGGVLLAGERGRPGAREDVGLVLALGCTLVFALRDTFVRWLAGDTERPGLAARDAGLGRAHDPRRVLVSRRPLVRPLPAYVPAGLMFGLSYVCLFEAFYRGRVSVVSPLVATESLWGVTLSALFLRRHELVGRGSSSGSRSSSRAAS